MKNIKALGEVCGKEAVSVLIFSVM